MKTIDYRDSKTQGKDRREGFSWFFSMPSLYLYVFVLMGFIV
jgi:hypothetical protein